MITGSDDQGRPVSGWAETPGESAPYGFMERVFESTVERRQATPDELAAAVARETPAGYLRIKPPATLSQFHAVSTEATMDEPTPVRSPLTALSDAAALAHEKFAAVGAAEQAWEVAREALAKAMAECFAVIGSPVTPAAKPKPDEPGIVPEPPRALRQPGHHDSHPGQAAARAERAARVTEAVARHGGDRSAAAAELGMRPNAVAMVMKFADRRAAANT